MPSSTRPRLRSDHPPSDHTPEPAPRPLPLLNENDDPLRVVYKPEALALVGVSFPTLWSLVRRGLFPAPRVVAGRTAWLRHEIAA
jgi:predicted DNA-binding transcriptional regulator AlpA